jgi:Heterokaryon incompatibility protein (HET)
MIHDSFSLLGPNSAELDTKHIVPTNSASDLCFENIRSWLAECSRHDKCKSQREARLPKRILEVPSDPSSPIRLCLSDGRIGSYLALSSCRGDANIAKLTGQTLSEFENAINPSLLARSFQDAITITRRLGFRYLWIDALCILQDNQSDWVEQSLHMKSIYGNATLTIAASAADDSSKGIFSDRHVYYSPALGLNKEYYLRQKLLRWKSKVEESPLGRRGWAVQERYLAPRVLHFTKHQLIWECASTWHFEASGIPDNVTGSGQIRMRYRKDYVQRFIDEAVDERQPSADPRDAIRDLSERLEAWHQCVDNISTGALTIPSDKLPAMAGVASALGDGGALGEYLGGAWSASIGISLSWCKSYAKLKQAASYRAPSWSWASVDGAISSLVLNWPTSLLPDQVDNPDWIMRYRPKLVEHKMIRAYNTSPYMGVREGSYISMEGSCKGFMSIVENIDKEIFRILPLLDVNDLFTCSICSRGGSHDEGNEEHVEDNDSLMTAMKSWVCMIL